MKRLVWKEQVKQSNMKKTLSGTVTSIKMNDTAIVEVKRKIPHKLYKKLMNKSKKYKADTNEVKVAVGDVVKILTIRPLSKDKYFKVSEIVTKLEA